MSKVQLSTGAGNHVLQAEIDIKAKNPDAARKELAAAKAEFEKENPKATAVDFKNAVDTFERKKLSAVDEKGAAAKNDIALLDSYLPPEVG